MQVSDSLVGRCWPAYTTKTVCLLLRGPEEHAEKRRESESAASRETGMQTGSRTPQSNKSESRSTISKRCRRDAIVGRKGGRMMRWGFCLSTWAQQRTINGLFFSFICGTIGYSTKTSTVTSFTVLKAFFLTFHHIFLNLRVSCYLYKFSWIYKPSYVLFEEKAVCTVVLWYQELSSLPKNNVPPIKCENI